VVLRAVSPEWVPSWNCLTNVGASDWGMAIWLSVNFHHLSGRKFPSSVSNQAYSCDIYHGSHSGKHEKKAAASDDEVCPLWGLLTWLPYQPFGFPKHLFFSPFWCPRQCMTVTCLGAHTASSNSRISCPYLTLFPHKLMSLLSLHRAPWSWMVVKEYLESVGMFIRTPAASTWKQ
jgi:hypothetical protein